MKEIIEILRKIESRIISMPNQSPRSHRCLKLVNSCIKKLEENNDSVTTPQSIVKTHAMDHTTNHDGNEKLT